MRLKPQSLIDMTDKNKKIDIEYVDINLLNPSAYNPRKHDKESEEQLRQSIENFGVVNPVVVNLSPKRQNIVIGGNFRFEILKQMKFKQVPVV